MFKSTSKNIFNFLAIICICLIFCMCSVKIVKTVIPLEREKLQSLENIAIVVNSDPQITYHEFRYRVLWNTERTSKYPMLAWDLSESVSELLAKKLLERKKFSIIPYDSIKSISQQAKKYGFKVGDEISFKVNNDGFKDSVIGTVVHTSKEGCTVKREDVGIYKGRNYFVNYNDIISLDTYDYSLLIEKLKADGAITINFTEYGIAQSHGHKPFIKGNLKILNLSKNMDIIYKNKFEIFGNKIKNVNHFRDLEKHNFKYLKAELENVISELVDKTLNDLKL